MSTEFELITEEFSDDLGAIRALVAAFNGTQTSTPKARVAAANSATLLLAATFEEYVRQMARAYARVAVTTASKFEKLPPKLVATAWRRTLEALARIQVISDPHQGPNADSNFTTAIDRFTAIYEFCKGDISQDIYADLIHNENNMRPGEINSLFKLSDVSNICQKVSDKKSLLDNFGETDAAKAHGQLLIALNEFFERRNKIAHALNPGQSSGPDQIMKDIDLLESFGNSLAETLGG